MSTMQVFNVQIFNRNYSLVDHFEINEFKYKEDFLSYEKNTIKCAQTIAEVGQYILIQSSGGERYSGIITAVDTDKDERKITFTEWQKLLDVDFLCDTTLLASKTLESFIAYYLEALYKSSGDDSQSIPGIVINILSANTGTIDFDLKQNSDGTTVTMKILNLYDDVVLPAFTTYGVRVMFDYQPEHSRFVVDIQKCPNSTITIEADLPNSTIDKFVLRKSSKTTNKDIVYNDKLWTQYSTYYLLSDCTIGTDATSSLRMLPVDLEVETVSYDSTKDTDTTFETMALAKATTTLSKNKYTNLIQLKFLKDDELINPVDMQIGQTVSIIHDSVSYSSYLTGRELDDDTATLIFGNIRLELTKKLMGRA